MLNSRNFNTACDQGRIVLDAQGFIRSKINPKSSRLRDAAECFKGEAKSKQSGPLHLAGMEAIKQELENEEKENVV